MPRPLEAPVLRTRTSGAVPRPATRIVSSSAKCAQPLHAILRLEPVRFLAVAQGVLLPPVGELSEPGGPVGRAVLALPLRQLDGELADHVLAVADDRHVGDPVLTDLGRVDVDVHDLRVGGEGRELAGDAVVEPRAERDQQIGALHRRDRGVVPVHARHAEAELVRIGERAPRHQGRDDREAGRSWRARAAPGAASALMTPPPT